MSDRSARRRAGRPRLHARRRGPRAVRGRPRRRRPRAAARGGQLDGQVGALPGRRRPGDRPPGGHRRPPPRLGGAPARLGVPRPVAGRPARRPDRHPAALPAHVADAGAEDVVVAVVDPVGGARPALVDAAGAAVPRRQPHRGVRPPRPGRLGRQARRRRHAGHPRRLPRPGRRRPGALRRLPPGASRPATSRSCPAPARCGCCGGCGERPAGRRAGRGAGPDRGADPRVRRGGRRLAVVQRRRRARPRGRDDRLRAAAGGRAAGAGAAAAGRRRGGDAAPSRPAIYGICETCGRPIAPERLAARPAARTCIDCAR